MFDIGFWEVAVIGVMALLILGPERLPGAIKSTMATVRNIKEMAAGFKAEVSSQIDAHELHADLKKAEQLGMQNIGKDLQESVNELKQAAESVQRPYQKKSEDSPDKPDEAADISALLPENSKSSPIGLSGHTTTKKNDEEKPTNSVQSSKSENTDDKV